MGFGESGRERGNWVYNAFVFSAVVQGLPLSPNEIRPEGRAMQNAECRMQNAECRVLDQTDEVVGLQQFLRHKAGFVVRQGEHHDQPDRSGY